MTTLDDRLYAWLSEADDLRCTFAFNAYFLEAYPAVVRHLTRFAPSDLSLLEEIAQDSLLKFFERIGRGRRTAAEAVAGSLRRIQPVSLGAFHEREVRSWTRDVDSFRRMAMGFRLTQVESDQRATWKNTIHELTLQISNLQRQGWHLIDGVRIELQWQAAADQDASPEIPVPPAPDPATVDLANAVLASAPSACSAEIRLPGSLQFVHCAATVIHALPRLRVPTNGYLFEIATSLYLDHYRKRRRHKRGGSGCKPAPYAARENADESFQHPLENLLIDQDLDEDSLADAAADASRGARLSTAVECVSIDPIRSLEDEEYFERFHAYLRAPLDAAESAYEAALARGSALAERRKWESLAQKFSRTMAVLTAIGEGYTQEQAAERLQLSRNKVKYVIETLQEAYARFAARSAGPPHALPARGVSSHAR